MRNQITVQDVVKDGVDLTQVRFRIVEAMLQEDGELVKLVLDYLEKLSTKRSKYV